LYRQGLFGSLCPTNPKSLSLGQTKQHCSSAMFHSMLPSFLRCQNIVAKLSNIVGQRCCTSFILFFQYCFISSSKSTIPSQISLSSLIMGRSMVCLAFEELCHYLKLLLYPFMCTYKYEIELNCCPNMVAKLATFSWATSVARKYLRMFKPLRNKFFHGFVSWHVGQTWRHFGNI